RDVFCDMHPGVQKERVQDNPFCAVCHPSPNGLHDIRLCELKIGICYAIVAASGVKHAMKHGSYKFKVVCVFLWTAVAYKYYALIHKCVYFSFIYFIKLPAISLLHTKCR